MNALAPLPAKGEPLRPITIAITALGGQGGGVLADWIVELAEANGYIAQSTSVPGVAQRTGATVYYLELFPKIAANRDPVLALMPMPGDVDIVIAAELMEAGRAMLRGFVTPERTTLIASTHRDYAIAEKSAMGDGIASSENITRAAAGKAKEFIAFDMAKSAAETESVISAVLFGALAGSGRLPFPNQSFETTIEHAGIAVKSNLSGFRRGIAGVADAREAKAPPVIAKPDPIGEASTPSGKAILDRLRQTFPPETHEIIAAGVRRMADYQDQAYAGFYLERLEKILAADRQLDGASKGWLLINEAARYLALWMSYEDTIRVADLKTRASRFARVREEVKAKDDQIVYMSEYMSPRVEEICDTMPARWGDYVLESPRLKGALGRIFQGGKRMQTAKLGGFLTLYFLAGLRRIRRKTLKYREEQHRIETWMARMHKAASDGDYGLALEITECQRLVKGYSDTFARGLRNYETIMAALDRLPKDKPRAEIVQRLREAALADEMGVKLRDEMARLEAG